EYRITDPEPLERPGGVGIEGGEIEERDRGEQDEEEPRRACAGLHEEDQRPHEQVEDADGEGRRQGDEDIFALELLGDERDRAALGTPRELDADGRAALETFDAPEQGGAIADGDAVERDHPIAGPDSELAALPLAALHR